MADDVKIKLQGSILNSLATQSQNPVASKPSALPQSIISNESLIPKSTPVDNTRVVTALGVISNKMEQGFSQTISSVTKLQVAVTSRLESIHRQLEILNRTMETVHNSTLSTSNRQQIPTYLRIFERVNTRLFNLMNNLYQASIGSRNATSLNIAFMRLFFNQPTMRRLFGLQTFLTQQKLRERSLNTDEIYYTLRTLPDRLFEVSDEIVRAVDRLSVNLSRINIEFVQTLNQHNVLLTNQLMSVQYNLGNINRTNSQMLRRVVLPFFEVLLTSRFENLRQAFHLNIHTLMETLSTQIQTATLTQNDFFIKYTAQFDERMDRQYDILEMQLKCCTKTNILLDDILNSLDPKRSGGGTRDEYYFGLHPFMKNLETNFNHLFKRFSSDQAQQRETLGYQNLRYADRRRPHVNFRGRRTIDPTDHNWQRTNLTRDMVDTTNRGLRISPTDKNYNIIARRDANLNSNLQGAAQPNIYNVLRNGFSLLNKTNREVVEGINEVNVDARTRRNENLEHRRADIERTVQQDTLLREQQSHLAREQDENGVWRRNSLRAYERQYTAIMGIPEAISRTLGVLVRPTLRILKYISGWWTVSFISRTLLGFFSSSTGFLGGITSGVNNAFNSFLPSVTGVIKGFFESILPESIQKSFFEITDGILSFVKNFATMTFSLDEDKRSDARNKLLSGIWDVIQRFALEYFIPGITHIVGALYVLRGLRNLPNLFRREPQLDAFGKPIPEKRRTLKDVFAPREKVQRIPPINETAIQHMGRVSVEVGGAISRGAIRTGDFINVVSRSLLRFVGTGLHYVFRAMNWVVMAVTVGKLLFKTIPNLFKWITNKDFRDKIAKDRELQKDTTSLWRAIFGNVTQNVKSYIYSGWDYFMKNKGKIWDSVVGIFTGIIDMIWEIGNELFTDIWLYLRKMVATSYLFGDEKWAAELTKKEEERKSQLDLIREHNKALRAEHAEKDNTEPYQNIEGATYTGFIDNLNKGFGTFISSFEKITNEIKNMTDVNTSVGQGFASSMGNLIGKLFGGTEGDKFLANAQKYAESKGEEWTPTVNFFKSARTSLKSMLEANAAKEAETAARNARTAEMTEEAAKIFKSSAEQIQLVMDPKKTTKEKIEGGKEAFKKGVGAGADDLVRERLSIQHGTSLREQNNSIRYEALIKDIKSGKITPADSEFRELTKQVAPNYTYLLSDIKKESSRDRLINTVIEGLERKKDNAIVQEQRVLEAQKQQKSHISLNELQILMDASKEIKPEYIQQLEEKIKNNLLTQREIDEYTAALGLRLLPNLYKTFEESMQSIQNARLTDMRINADPNINVYGTLQDTVKEQLFQHLKKIKENYKVQPSQQIQVAPYLSPDSKPLLKDQETQRPYPYMSGGGPLFKHIGGQSLNVGGPEEKSISTGQVISILNQQAIQNSIEKMTLGLLNLSENLFSTNTVEQKIGSSILPGGVLVSKFGDRIDPITKKQAFHSGIDIKAASGQAIPAYDYGIVTKLAQDKDYGKNMIVNYPALHTFFRYAHLKDYGKNIYEGQTLAPNQEIGYVGNTGRSTGPHLHLEVIRGNVNPTFKNINREDYINPELFLKEQSNKKKLAEIKEKINTQAQTNTGGPLLQGDSYWPDFNLTNKLDYTKHLISRYNLPLALEDPEEPGFGYIPTKPEYEMGFGENFKNLFTKIYPNEFIYYPFTRVRGPQPEIDIYEEFIYSMAKEKPEYYQKAMKNIETAKTLYMNWLQLQQQPKPVDVNTIQKEEEKTETRQGSPFSFIKKLSNAVGEKVGSVAGNVSTTVGNAIQTQSNTANNATTKSASPIVSNTNNIMDSVKRMIKNHEGLRLERYICPTGHPTIGYGHTGIHVQKGRITQAEADQIFEEDFIKYSALAKQIPEFSNLDPARQGALIDLVYNLGYKGFMNFQKTRQALATQNWSEAASELLNSRYARQVGRRAQTIANIFKTGQLGNMPSTISPTGATSVIASEADSVQGVPTQPINIASTGSNIIANLLRGSGRISSKFGMRTHPVDKTQKLHKGIDVAAGAGTPIISPWPGKVIINKNNPKGYGWYTVIDHGNFATLYGHMSQQSPLAVGSQVNTGDVIGMVGSTGASTGPHLHFEVRPGSGNYFNRSPVDPLTFTGATLPSSAMDAVDTAAQEMTQQTHITPPQIKPGSEAFKRLNINNLNKAPQQISKQITPQAIKAIQKPVLPAMKTPTVVSDPINDRFNQLVQQYGLNDPDKQAKLDQKYNTLVTSKGIGGLDSFIPSINFGGIGNNLLGRVAGLTSQIPMMKTLSSLEDQNYLANVLQGATGSGEGNTNNTNNINANTAQPNIIIINQNTSSMANSSQSLASEQHNNGSKSSAANIFGTW